MFSCFYMSMWGIFKKLRTNNNNDQTNNESEGNTKKKVKVNVSNKTLTERTNDFERVPVKRSSGKRKTTLKVYD